MFEILKKKANIGSKICLYAIKIYYVKEIFLLDCEFYKLIEDKELVKAFKNRDRKEIMIKQCNNELRKGGF